MDQKILWKIYVGIMGAVTTVVAQKAISGLWKSTTGGEPPQPNDPDTPLGEALTWALASGLGVGVVSMLTNRFAARRFAAMGAKPPKPSTLKMSA